MYNSPRQCVVRLDREWIFEMYKASFRLKPRRAPTDQDKAAFVADRLTFVRQIPDEFRTFQGTLEVLEALGYNRLHWKRSPNLTTSVEGIQTGLSQTKGSNANSSELLALADTVRWKRLLICILAAITPVKKSNGK